MLILWLFCIFFFFRMIIFEWWSFSQKCLFLTAFVSLLLDVSGGSLQAASGRSVLQAQFARLRFLHAELPLFLLLLGSCRYGFVPSQPCVFGPETLRFLRCSGRIGTRASFLGARVIHVVSRTSVSVQSRRDAFIAAVSDSEPRLAVRLLVFLVLRQLSSDAYRVQRIFSAPRGAFVIQILLVPCVRLRPAGAVYFICRHTQKQTASDSLTPAA